MEGIIFKKSYEVHSYDTEPNGKLRPDALLSYLQDIAGYHASKLSFGRDDLLQQNKFWALARIIFKLRSTPSWNDTIIIKTWPKGLDKIFAIRNFQICNNEGDVLGEASSSWVILDVDSRRPVRPGLNLAEYGQNNPIKGFSCLPAEKLQEVSNNAYTSPVNKVRLTDLDVNMHVNNAKYLQWVLDTYPLDYILTKQAMVIEANYLSETLPGEDYTVSAEEKEDSFLHSVVKEGSGTEACRFRIEWQT